MIPEFEKPGTILQVSRLCSAICQSWAVTVAWWVKSYVLIVLCFRGDTASVLSIGSMILFGSWMTRCWNWTERTFYDAPLPIHWPTVTELSFAMLRMAVGLILVTLLKVATKATTISLLCSFLQVDFFQDETSDSTFQDKLIETVYKMVCYGSMTLVLPTAPILFTYLGIHRPLWIMEGWTHYFSFTS